MFLERRDAVKPTQPSFQLVPGAFSPGYRGRSVNLATCLHLTATLRICVVMSLIPYSYRGVMLSTTSNLVLSEAQGQLYKNYVS